MGRNSYDWRWIDELMLEGLEGKIFPAAVLRVTHKGNVVFHRAYGWIDPDSRLHPATESTLFDLASLTKLFTATAFMTLVDSGRIGLDDPVGTILPEFRGMRSLVAQIDPLTKTRLPLNPDFAGVKIDAGKVTFRQLLTHTSGLAAWSDLCSDQTPAHSADAEIRRERMESLLRTLPFTYPPGKGFTYSDLGFVLLGEIVERLTGESLAEYVRRSVTAPLGLSSVAYTPLSHGVRRESVAPTEYYPERGHRAWGEVHDENAFCLGGIAGHAGLFACARDVSLFGQSFLYEKHPILSSRSRREMLKEQVHHQGIRRGLGWQLPGDDGMPVGKVWSRSSFGHTGFTGTSLWLDPVRQLNVALLTNRVYYGRDAKSIVDFRLRLHTSIAHLVDDAKHRGLNRTREQE